jgi:hypothetical protein
MRNILKSLLFLGSATLVHATPVTFTDIVNPTDQILSINGTRFFSYTHNIMDNGFLPGSDAITDADIYITLSDDFDIFQGESVRISLDNTEVAHSMNVGYDTYSFNVVSSLLQTDGSLSVTLEVLSGDFWFQQSRLEVAANHTQAVPEPGTMALMGLGLAGIGFAARRRKA